MLMVVRTRKFSSWYLNCTTNHLDETVKNTSLFSFKRLPMQKTLVNSKSSNGYPMAKTNVFHHTIHKSINIFLQHQIALINRHTKTLENDLFPNTPTCCRSIYDLLNLLSDSVPNFLTGDALCGSYMLKW